MTFFQHFLDMSLHLTKFFDNRAGGCTHANYLSIRRLNNFKGYKEACFHKREPKIFELIMKQLKRFDGKLVV